jgi:DNA-binding response OmpR family regulator
MTAMSVLIVEDDTTIAKLLREFLERGDHHVAVSSTISEAREALFQMSPDVVFLDMNLPDGKGLDLIPLLRKNHDCHIIAMSGNQQFMLKTLSGTYHADVFLTKPFDFKTVKKTLSLQN